MTENKRFELENENGTICIRDNIRKKYIFAFICEDIDMEEGMLEECENVVNCLNQTWEMTLRFEKYNKEYIEDNEKLKRENEELKASKEFWREECISNSSLNQILTNELDIAQKEGYEPTNSFKQHIVRLVKEKGEND